MSVYKNIFRKNNAVTAIYYIQPFLNNKLFDNTPDHNRNGSQFGAVVQWKFWLRLIIEKRRVFS